MEKLLFPFGNGRYPKLNVCVDCLLICNSCFVNLLHFTSWCLASKLDITILLFDMSIILTHC